MNVRMFVSNVRTLDLNICCNTNYLHSKVFDLAEMETRRYEDQSFVKFLEAGNEIEAFVSKFEKCGAKKLPNSFAQT